MPDASVPYLKDIKRLLADVKTSLGGLDEHLKHSNERVEKGVLQLSGSVAAQTAALGEIELLSLRAQLDSLAKLLELERQHLASEKSEDVAALEVLEERFDAAISRIAGVRNERVQKLLQPVLDLVDNDHGEHLEVRTEEVDELLDEFLAVTLEQVENREATVRGLLQEIRDRVRRFASQREELQQRLANTRLNASRLPDFDPSGTCYGIPFHLVRISGRNGEVRFTIASPSRVRKRTDHVYGFELEPLDGFEEPRADLRTKTAALFSVAKAQAKVETKEYLETASRKTPRNSSWVGRLVASSFPKKAVRIYQGSEETTSVSVVLDQHCSG